MRSGTDIDGPPGVASISQFTRRIASDSDGNLVLWGDRCLRRVTSSGAITTLAGDCQNAGSVDGSSLTARFAAIASIAALPERKFLVVDNQSLRLVNVDGNVVTLRALSPSSVTLAGDGRGTIVASSADGIDLWFGRSFEQSARLVDIGARTAVGPLPTTIATLSGIAIGGGRIYVVAGDSVFAIDL